MNVDVPETLAAFDHASQLFWSRPLNTMSPEKRASPIAADLKRCEIARHTGVLADDEERTLLLDLTEVGTPDLQGYTIWETIANTIAEFVRIRFRKRASQL